eukprot:TRINITY_DN12861_c0_g1_i3.p1 TRINITY_DN12861_c0_g1~~TRINITY_DN12861_c0_g1_i3.p1  ORF type:complete len:139 (-),score=27.43 TRINITY_DN12861_c0_g1_i3:562-978(-)
MFRFFRQSRLGGKRLMSVGDLPPPPRRISGIAQTAGWIAGAVLGTAAVAAGFYAFDEYFREQNANAGTATRSRPMGELKIGGSFELTDQDGKRRSSSEFKGKYMLIYFGFANCPDFVICLSLLLMISKINNSVIIFSF